MMKTLRKSETEIETYKSKVELKHFQGFNSKSPMVNFLGDGNEKERK